MTTEYDKEIINKSIANLYDKIEQINRELRDIRNVLNTHEIVIREIGANLHK